MIKGESYVSVVNIAQANPSRKKTTKVICSLEFLLLLFQVGVKRKSRQCGDKSKEMTKDRSSYLTIPSASPAKQATGFPDDGMIDNLTYAYNGNQLQSVHDVNDPNHQNNGFTDAGSFLTTEYHYDNNGNMIADSNKHLSISRYNHLNLPEQLNLNPPQHYYEISYLYSAAGQKLHKATHIDFTPATTTDYVGSFIYQDGLLQSILTPEGRVVVDGSNYEYQYFLKDHLGNTRITFNENKQIIQEDSYYPYGMNMVGLSHSSSEDLPNKYLYNGKELQDDFGLGWYDYGARFYDAQLGRWHVVDPLAEDYFALSPYNYVANNPLKFIDPNGM
ncbi:MAG: RHS repeat-associated core domain-containing protein, partial [Bacteroidales bacterium]|nr:RHS repeat-associated core domain-containing protein [Bacteroidales bacterium]